ncbi:MAG: SDR family oxidoreductase [Rhodobacteraceae bacterium]|nr:SDR family oxidoreductase [Paracoccaceae bacterium]
MPEVRAVSGRRGALYLRRSRLTYKAALITGGAVRLGRAMALGLAARGTSVAVHYAGSIDAAEATVGELKTAGVQAVALQADLLDEAQMADVVDRAVDGLGQPLDVLINNASIFEHDDIRTATKESWDRHINSNLRAPFVLTQAFACQVPEVLTDAAGELLAPAAIINMVDQRVRKPTPEFMTYTIAKMGLWAFTRTSARALAPQVRVNAIGPGPTLQGHRQSAEHFAGQRQATVLQRGADPAGIVAAMNYLLDAPAVTGQLICVDGGQHLAWETPDVLCVE